MSAPAGNPTPAQESALLRLIAPPEPARGRLIALWIVLLLWIIALVAIYFLAVAPRHPSPPERGLSSTPSNVLPR